MNEENEEKKDAVVCAHCGSVIDVDGGECIIETAYGEIICEDDCSVSVSYIQIMNLYICRGRYRKKKHKKKEKEH